MGQQQDAQEFLLGLQESMAQVRDWRCTMLRTPRSHSLPHHVIGQSVCHTHLHALFISRISRQIVCRTCGRHTGRTDPTGVHSVSIAELGSVERALEQHHGHEEIDGYDCTACRRRTQATSTLLVSTLPQILVVHLERFEYALEARKLTHHVAFERRLDLQRFTTRAQVSWCLRRARRVRMATRTLH